MMTHVPKRVAVVVATSLAVALLVSACGGSSGSDSTEAATTTSGESGSESTASAAPMPPLTPPTSIAVKQPLKELVPKQSVAWLACNLPVCQEALSEGNHNAGEALDWNIQQINYETAKAAQAVQQALDANVDGISITGIPPAAFEQQAQEAIAKKIPIVSCSDTTAPEPKKNGIFSQCNGEPGWHTEAEYVTNWAINDANGAANIVTVTIEEYPVLQVAVASAEEAVGACAECGDLGVVPVTVEEVGEGKVPAKLVGYLQSHPETNYVMFTFADLAIGTSPALKSAGLSDSVKSIGLGANPTITAEMAKGEQAAWSLRPENLLGWLSMDVLARLATNTPIEQYELEGQAPSWVAAGPAAAKKLLSEGNGEWPGPVGFEAKFKKLWGV